MDIFPGEVFVLSLSVLDQNNNKKIGFYTYPSNMFITEADITEIDITTGNKNTSFAGVSGSSNQKTSLVIRNSTKNFSFSNNGTIDNTTFTLNLIDSSTGVTVCNNYIITLDFKL